MSKRLWLLLGVVLAMGLLFACASNSETPPSDSVTQTIDSDGGSVESPVGASVVVPANALTEPVALTVMPLGSAAVKTALPSDVAYAGEPVAFKPVGTIFAVPVTISIPTDGAADLVMSLDDASGANWTEVSGVQFSTNRAVFQSTRFATFAACKRAGVTTGNGGSSSTTGAGGSTASLTGGMANFGGSFGMGGMIVTGGSANSGGSSGLGGAITPATGGSLSGGGTTGVGGASSSGGVVANGASPNLGGAVATGGVGSGASASTPVTAGSAGRASAGGQSTGGQSTGGQSTGGIGAAAGVAGSAGTAGAPVCVLSDLDTSCQICLGQKCCAQKTACLAQNYCTTFYNCFTGQSRKSYGACTADVAEIPPTIPALNECATANCSSACGGIAL